MSEVSITKAVTTSLTPAVSMTTSKTNISISGNPNAISSAWPAVVFDANTVTASPTFKSLPAGGMALIIFSFISDVWHDEATLQLAQAVIWIILTCTCPLSIACTVPLCRMLFAINGCKDNNKLAKNEDFWEKKK